MSAKPRNRKCRIYAQKLTVKNLKLIKNINFKKFNTKNERLCVKQDMLDYILNGYVLPKNKMKGKKQSNFYSVV